jgi:hypothetical protein
VFLPHNKHGLHYREQPGNADITNKPYGQNAELSKCYVTWDSKPRWPPVAQLLKNFPTFYGTQSSLPCSQEPSTDPYSESDQSSPYHPILRSFLILSFDLRLGPPGSLIPPSHQNPIGIPLLHDCYMPCQSQSPSLDHYNYTWRRVQVMKLFIMYFSPASYHLHTSPTVFVIFRNRIVSTVRSY